ncbi:MAG TPA: hypothetical protein VIY48_01310 [Candidatus Paceibacterota bacterium]
MTNWGFDNSQTDDQGNDAIDSPGGLRQFAEKTQKENKELKDQLEQIQRTLAVQSTQSVFNELGVPGAASLYQGDADPAKIKAWVEDQRKIFGGSTQGTPEVTPPVDTPPADTLPPLLQQQMEAFNQAGQQGSPLGSIEQAQANVNDATDLQGLINAMNFGR